MPAPPQAKTMPAARATPAPCPRHCPVPPGFPHVAAAAAANMRGGGPPTPPAGPAPGPGPGRRPENPGK
eukprot:gene21663-biopygen20681